MHDLQGRQLVYLLFLKDRQPCIASYTILCALVAVRRLNITNKNNPIVETTGLINQKPTAYEKLSTGAMGRFSVNY
jgi:hypothetical protein